MKNISNQSNANHLAAKNIISLWLSRFFSYLFLITISIACLFSFYILIVNASRSHGELISSFNFLPGTFFFKNLTTLLSDTNIPILRALFNSLLVSTISAAFSTYFSSMTAYGIHVYDFKGKSFAFTFIMVVLMIPTQVPVLGFLQLITKMNLMDSLVPLIIPSIAAPAVFFYMKQYIESIVPLEIVEAARVDGANEFFIFNRIILPIIKPAIAVQAIFSFTFSWNNYFVPALVISSNEKKTIPILIAQLRSADYMKFDLGQVYIMIFVAIIPLMLVYIFLSKYIIQGLTIGSVKG